MPEEDPFFAELNAVISKATAKSKLKLDAAKLKKQSLNMRLDANIRRRAAEEYAGVQAIIDANMWRAVRYSAMFTEQHCDGCDTIHHTFLQYMQEEEKVSNPRTRRWVRVVRPDDSLPRETIVQPLSTHICASCCADHGFDIDAPTIRLMPIEGSLTVSAKYIQGDINGPPQEN